MNRWLFRLAPWVVTLVVAGWFQVSRFQVSGSLQSVTWHVQPETWNLKPGTLSPETCTTLHTLSADAAALTGSLALVEGDERPARAADAAAQVRDLAGQAATVEGGAELSWLLGDLATALERYAGGDPSAAAAVQDTSARNAELRARYEACCAVRVP